MKILLAYPNRELDNPFVKTLYTGLLALGCEIIMDLDEFWGNYAKYDIIHINWPQSLFVSWNPTNVEVLFLERIIKEIKEKSIKIVYTRHNEIPHYSTSGLKLRCYQIIEQNADAIVHLGDYGVEVLRKIINCKHYIVPHHIYDKNYTNSLTKREARSKLGISNKKYVILTFGAFRDKEEVDLVLSAYTQIKIKNKYLLAPRIGITLGLIKTIQNFIMRTIQKLSNKTKMEFDKFVSDSDLPVYFSAADVVLIQRNKILNSGNLPMAFFFKKLVIGPNIGNVGIILKKTNNIVFEPSNKNSLIRALERSFHYINNEIGESNYSFATNYWNTDIIAHKYLEIYRELHDS